MRIAHICYRCEPALGGAEVYISDLAAGLSDLVTEQDFFQATPRTDRAIVVSSPKLTPLKLVNFNLGLLGIRQTLARYDRFIVHNPEHVVPWLPARKTVLVSHGATWTHEQGWRRKLRLRSTVSAVRKVGTVVANDTFVPRELGLDIAPATRLHSLIAPGVWFVPNGVDVHRFNGDGELIGYDEHAEALEAPFIVVPRNLTYPRGVDMAVAAFGRSGLAGEGVHMVVAGAAIHDNTASREFAAGLKQRVRADGLETKVHFLGSVSRENMPGLFSGAAMTLIPTRFSEGTSLSALESMSSGVATVCTAVEGLLDLPAWHAEPSVAAIAEALQEAWPRRRELAAQQQAAVRQDYSQERWIASWRQALTGPFDGKRQP